MTDFSNLISNAVAAKMTPDFIEKEVNTRVEKLIIESIDSALRGYSKTGKQIEEAVENALRVDRLDLPAYGHVVSQILKVQIEAKVSELVSGQLAKDMDELLSLAPKEVKLSEIAKQMLERSSEEWGECITVIVETTEFGSTWVYLDEDEVIDERNKYQCKHHFGVGKDGHIYGATVDGRAQQDTKNIGRSYGIGQMLRAYVACGTKIILDEEFVERGKGDY